MNNHHHNHDGHDHNHDGHHDGPNGNRADVTRRQLLYVLSSGILGVALFPALGAEAATKRKKARATAPKPTTPKATAPATTLPKAPTAAGSLDPWSFFPGTVKASRTATEVFVESTGVPEHQMMVGITNWQQQVPLQQPYSGSNAWRIPLRGVLADVPISAKTSLSRGAIALAINGVPIFNALNNRGEDSFLIGELDQWGGHCGRADDYHYHAAPLHLQKTSGVATPIAIALDGFPVYGLTEPDGSPARALDEFNGHQDSKDTYHYHSTLTYPYINGGMRGKVQVVAGQVDPQPTASPARPAGTPLRGAAITAFTKTGTQAYALEYQLAGQLYRIEYGPDGSGFRFVYTDPTGTSRSETYQRR